MMVARIVVEEGDYAVIARVPATDANGEEVPRSDRISTALQVAWGVEARCGRAVQVIEDETGPAAVVELGDAPESEFEETAGAILEIAASW